MYRNVLKNEIKLTINLAVGRSNELDGNVHLLSCSKQSM
jgi:hypothetical protein